MIVWKIGIAMGIGQFAGAQAGSRFAMKRGSGIIRPMLVIVCILLAIRLLADPANPVRIWLGF